MWVIDGAGSTRPRVPLDAFVYQADLDNDAAVLEREDRLDVPDALMLAAEPVDRHDFVTAVEFALTELDGVVSQPWAVTDAASSWLR